MKALKFNSLIPVIWSDQFDETLAFYTQMLDFMIVARNDEWGWATLIKDRVEIMVARPNQHATFKIPGFTGSFYINTDNLQILWDRLKDKVRIVYEPEDFPWQMREFAIYDNNGYTLQFGQAITEAK